MEHAARRKQCLVKMRDGARLSTHVRLPKDGGPWPVIFGRSPYPGALPAWLERAEYWAEQGYAFVYQECRGTGQSEGDWIPFVHERQDGLDSLEWIIRQEWSDGNIGTYGASYSGTLQWSMAGQLPAEVKTMFISVAGIERYKQNYMNGMFRHDIYTVWALRNAGHKPVRGAERLYEEALSVRPPIDMDRRLFGQTLPWYRDWVSRVDEDSEYWRTGLWAELKDAPTKCKVPVMMVAGWFDHNLEASTISYSKLPEEMRRQSCLIIGPWVHTLDVSGDLAYPGHDVWGPRQDRAALAWFDHHLKGKASEGLKGNVQAYIIGEGKWRAWDGWIQPSGSVRHYLTASPRHGAHGLSSEKPARQERISFEYDPDRPVRTRGGAALMAYLSSEPGASPPASVVQDAPGSRDDVISFVSEPCAEEMRIAGRIQARLFVSSDAEDTSFTVCLMEQLADGASYNIRDGITSLRYRNNAPSPQAYTPNSIVEVEIDLWPITWTVRKGSRLRVDVSSSNFPAYHAHPNVAGPWALQTEVRVARQTVYVGGDCASWIEIPTMD